MATIPALTLTEPWASLVAIGVKSIETRSWTTNYRGPIAIHAAKGMSGADVAFAQDDDIFDPLDTNGIPFFPNGGWCGPVKAAFPETRGRVLAIGHLRTVLRVTATDRYAVSPLGIIGEIPHDQIPFGDFTRGRFGWVIDDVQRLPSFIPATGSLGLWDWECPDELLAALAHPSHDGQAVA